MAKRKKRVRKSIGDKHEERGEGGGDYDEGLIWMQEVQIRPRSSRKPMARLSRWKRKFLNAKSDRVKTNASTITSPIEMNSISPLSEKQLPREPRLSVTSDGDDDDSIGEDKRKQFTVTKVKKRKHIFDFLRRKMEMDSGLSPNKLFVAYVNWTFSTGFSLVFFSFLVVFFFLNLLFALFLKFAGDAQPGCIVVSGEDFGFNPDTTFADAFALSWTTFTTVGYGMIYTSTGTDHHDQKSCSWVVFLCTSESFVGLLYAGMCAAILFGKVSRIQSAAQVIFSNSLCVQYGKKNVDSDTPQEPGAAKCLCPLIKFQIVNELSNSSNAIMDAMLKVLTSSKDTVNANSSIARYMKVDLMEFENPFFSQVWQGRHILNEKSPLLKSFAKDTIRKNGGFWPEEWNCPEKIHDCLDLVDLVVTIIGIADVSASTVHAYKRYTFEDVVVGYDFAPLLYRNSEAGRLKVDMTLIQDVIEDKYSKALPIEASMRRNVRIIA